MKKRILVVVFLTMLLSSCGNGEKSTSTHQHDYVKSVIEPSCTQNGYEVYTCECGDSYRGNVIPMGHDVTFHEEVLPENENETGSLAYIECRDCGYKRAVVKTASSQTPVEQLFGGFSYSDSLYDYISMENAPIRNWDASTYYILDGSVEITYPYEMTVSKSKGDTAVYLGGRLYSSQSGNMTYYYDSNYFDPDLNIPYDDGFHTTNVYDEDGNLVNSYMDLTDSQRVLYGVGTDAYMETTYLHYDDYDAHVSKISSKEGLYYSVFYSKNLETIGTTTTKTAYVENKGEDEYSISKGYMITEFCEDFSDYSGMRTYGTIDYEDNKVTLTMKKYKTVDKKDTFLLEEKVYAYQDYTFINTINLPLDDNYRYSVSCKSMEITDTLYDYDEYCNGNTKVETTKTAKKITEGKELNSTTKEKYTIYGLTEQSFSKDELADVKYVYSLTSTVDAIEGDGILTTTTTDSYSNKPGTTLTVKDPTPYEITRATSHSVSASDGFDEYEYIKYVLIDGEEQIGSIHTLTSGVETYKYLNVDEDGNPYYVTETYK